MADDVTGDALRGFGLPYALTPASIWTDKATFTQQGPTPGQPAPAGSYTLALQAAGAQSADKDLRVRVQRGGAVKPDGGAEFVYQYSGDSADQWRGHDVQPVSHHQVIRSTLEVTTGAVRDPDAATFYAEDRTDRICAVYQRQLISGGTSYIVEAATYDPSAGTWSTATIYSNADSPADGYHPTVAYNRVDGHLYCCHWIYDTAADLAQIATHRSPDGVTWQTVSEYALDVGVDISGTVGTGAAGYEVSRLRMGFVGGQCLLMGHVIKNDTDGNPLRRDWAAQFASESRGARFTTVSIDQVVATIGGLPSAVTSFSHHSVIVVDGTLTVVFPSAGNQAVPDYSVFYTVPLPSAFSPFHNRAAGVLNDSVFVFTGDSGSGITGPAGRVLQIGTYAVTDGDGSAWVGEDGAAYWAGRLLDPASVVQGAAFMMISPDGFRTSGGIQYAGDGGTWSVTGADASKGSVLYTGDPSTYLTDFVGVNHRGRQVLIGISETDVTTAKTLSATFLGGATTVTLPGRIAYPAPYQRSRWTESYVPFELPANISSLTTAGSGTDTIDADGVLNRSTTGSTAQTKTSYFGNTSTVAQGIIARMGITVVSGGSLTTDNIVMKLRTADGSDDYEVVVRFTRTALRIYDNNAGAPIGSDHGVVDGVSLDVLGAIAGNKFSLWVRGLDSKSDRDWRSLVQDHGLTSGGGSAAHAATALFGTVVTSATTNTYKIHEFHCMTGTNANGGLGGGQSNPADLRGRLLSRRGRYIGVDDGVRIVAVDGTAVAGDTFSIATAYDHPVERVLYRESPSPRSTWRSVAVTSGSCAEQLIPFVLNPDATTPGAEEQGFGGTLLYATFAGVNWSSGSIERWDTTSSAWVSVATLDNGLTTTFSLTRRGNELIVPAIPSPSTGRYFRENECAGWTVRFASGVCRRITGNTAGTLAPAVSSPKPVFRLDGIDGSEPTVSTVTLIPDKFAVTFHTSGETGGGWAVRIDAQTTTDLDVRCGHLSMGRVFVFGTQYGHGRVSMQESGDLIETTIGGVQRARRAGPGGRTVRIAWPDPIDTTQLQGATTAPDYLTSTTTAGNWPVAAQKDPPLSLRGVLQEVGALDAITYLPCIDIGGSDTIHHRFSDEFMLCTIASAVQVESVLGEECNPQTGEMFRVATVVLEEVR